MSTNPQLLECQEQIDRIWVQLSEKYYFDPQLGTLIDEKYEIKSFNFLQLKGILDNLHELNQNGEIVQKVQSLNSIKLQEPFNFKDILILHDALAMITQSYLVQKLKTIKEQEVKIPPNIAEPLHIASEFLKCSPGNITIFSYNWKAKHNRFRKDPFDLTYSDIDLKWHFTSQKQQQDNFFVLNIISTYYMWKIYRQIFSANYLIQNTPWLESQIIKKLDRASKFWRKFIEQNIKMMSMDDIYFRKTLNPYIAGFKSLYFQKVDKRYSAASANVAFDPSFQGVEQLMSYQFKQYNIGFDRLRNQLRKAMPEIHREFITYSKEITEIRQYCKYSGKLLQAYNKVLDSQIKFAKLHNELVIRFATKFTPGIQKKEPYIQLFGKLQCLQKNMLKYEQLQNE